jgi:hypothetical protein
MFGVSRKIFVAPLALRRDANVMLKNSEYSLEFFHMPIILFKNINLKVLLLFLCIFFPENWHPWENNFCPDEAPSLK